MSSGRQAAGGFGGFTTVIKLAGVFQAYLRANNLDLPVEVETRTLKEVQEVVSLLDRAGGGPRIDRVMLDNMARRNAQGAAHLLVLKLCCMQPLLPFCAVQKPLGMTSRCTFAPWAGQVRVNCFVMRGLSRASS